MKEETDIEDNERRKTVTKRNKESDMKPAI
jgi:hypothetical protein